MRSKKSLQKVLFLNLIIFASCFSSIDVFAQQKINKKLTPREIAKQTLPSTVLLVMTNDITKESKSGSGFFITEDVIATNFHVIKETTEGYVKIYGQNKVYDILGTVGVDEKNDLALLKIQGINGRPLKLNNDDLIAIGDEVFAVGNPKGLEGTFSQGIVSSIRKNDETNLLQITASISSGSSGGAILNDKGEVIGVAVGAIEIGQSLNFAIPISLLRNLLNKTSNIKFLSDLNLKFTEKKTDYELKKDKAFKIPDLLLKNLAGKIFSVKTSIFGNNLNKPAEVIQTEYNSAGNIVFHEITRYALYPKNSDIDDYVPGLEPDFDGGYINSFNQIYEYNNLGNSLRIKYFIRKENKQQFVGSEIIKYKDNKILEELKYDDKSNIKSRKEFNYTKNNEIIEVDFDEDGKECKRKEIQISINDKLEKIEDVRFAGIDCYVGFNFREVFTQLDDKTEIKKTVFDKSNNPQIIIKKVIDNNTKLIERIVIVQEDYTSSLLTQEFRYEYEFDTKGNWTKRTAYEKTRRVEKEYFIPFNIITREITYYKNQFKKESE